MAVALVAALLLPIDDHLFELEPYPNLEDFEFSKFETSFFVRPDATSRHHEWPTHSLPSSTTTQTTAAGSNWMLQLTILPLVRSHSHLPDLFQLGHRAPPPRFPQRIKPIRSVRNKQAGLD